MVFAENIVLTNILIAFVLNSGFIPQPSMALLTSFVLQVSSSLLDSFFYEEKKKKDNAHFLFYPRIRYFVLKVFFVKMVAINGLANYSSHLLNVTFIICIKSFFIKLFCTAKRQLLR